MRDLNATKEAILRAAEALFADRGYEGTSMQEIATAAGFSRGMPGYAFGSKRELYEAVLRRAFAQPRALVGKLAAAAESDAEEALRTGVEAYIEFLARHPAYVRLLQRAALEGDGKLEVSPSGMEALGDAVDALTGLLEAAGFRAVDPRQLLVSVIALCFFPLAHDHTLVRPLGLDAHDPRFLAERKTHVVDLLLNGLRDTPQGLPVPHRSLGGSNPRGGPDGAAPQRQQRRPLATTP